MIELGVEEHKWQGAGMGGVLTFSRRLVSIFTKPFSLIPAVGTRSKVPSYRLARALKYGI
jgi:hypothetical protein